MLPHHCQFAFHLYATEEFYQRYHTSIPLAVCLVVAATFIFLALSFFVYDLFVRKRNTIVVNAATRSTAIVSSLFPVTVRDRLLAEQHESESVRRKPGHFIPQRRARLDSIESSTVGLAETTVQGDDEENDYRDSFLHSRPIADLFLETTVLFADIAGFTAWSSTRQPSEVFTLLEAIFNSFDTIARQLGVYKVETIGDCYVAVTGLPTPRSDHAVVMARFARQCLRKMHHLVRKLEVYLGPDTADLSMRFGLHSGPVTAGVLRGERSRFQLFGDTMNTASRIESTGRRDRIHISQETAHLLIAGGKGHWVQDREDKVCAKGKGELSTFWVVPYSSEVLVSEGSEALSSSSPPAVATKDSANESKKERLVQWNVEVLLGALRRIVETCQHAQRTTAQANCKGSSFTDVIKLEQDSGSATLYVVPPSIEYQLHKYVTLIASLYKGMYRPCLD
jgi:class 3 adenylate cyclase